MQIFGLICVIIGVFLFAIGYCGNLIDEIKNQKK